jgi:rare lipoprotein A
MLHAQSGKDNASYYAKKFQGKKTASGEIFSNYDYTAAHRTLPFNTFLNVVNKENGYNVIVRVNDRGPFSKNRSIDLSEAAARRIGGYHHGLVTVKFEVIDLIQLTPELEESFSSPVTDCLGNKSKLSGISLSLWSTTDLLHAVYVANDLYLKEDEEILIVNASREGKRKYYVVVTGYADHETALKKKDYFEQKGFMKVAFYPLKKS